MYFLSAACPDPKSKFFMWRQRMELRCHIPQMPPTTHSTSFFFLAMFSLELSNEAWCLILELILGDCSCTHCRSLPSLSQVSLVHAPVGSWNETPVRKWSLGLCIPYACFLLCSPSQDPGSVCPFSHYHCFKKLTNKHGESNALR